MAPGDCFTGALYCRRKSSKKFLLVTTHKASFLLIHGNDWCAIVLPSESHHLYEVDEIMFLDQAATPLLGDCFIFIQDYGQNKIGSP